MTLIQELEQYRLEHKITQEQLARELGVAFATVNRWLNGKYKPRKVQQYHIEKFLAKRLGSLALTMGRSESNLKKTQRKKADT